MLVSETLKFFNKSKLVPKKKEKVKAFTFLKNKENHCAVCLPEGLVVLDLNTMNILHQSEITGIPIFLKETNMNIYAYTLDKLNHLMIFDKQLDLIEDISDVTLSSDSIHESIRNNKSLPFVAYFEYIQSRETLLFTSSCHTELNVLMPNFELVNFEENENGKLDFPFDKSQPRFQHVFRGFGMIKTRYDEEEKESFVANGQEYTLTKPPLVICLASDGLLYLYKFFDLRAEHLNDNLLVTPKDYRNIPDENIEINSSYSNKVVLHDSESVKVINENKATQNSILIKKEEKPIFDNKNFPFSVATKESEQKSKAFEVSKPESNFNLFVVPNLQKKNPETPSTTFFNPVTTNPNPFSYSSLSSQNEPNKFTSSVLFTNVKNPDNTTFGSNFSLINEKNKTGFNEFSDKKPNPFENSLDHFKNIKINEESKPQLFGNTGILKTNNSIISSIPQKPLKTVKSSIVVLVERIESILADTQKNSNLRFDDFAFKVTQINSSIYALQDDKKTVLRKVGGLSTSLSQIMHTEYKQLVDEWYSSKKFSFVLENSYINSKNNYELLNDYLEKNIKQDIQFFKEISHPTEEINKKVIFPNKNKPETDKNNSSKTNSSLLVQKRIEKIKESMQKLKQKTIMMTNSYKICRKDVYDL